MRKVILLILGMSCFLACRNGKARDPIAYAPAKPEPGQSVSVQYRPGNIPEGEAFHPELICYLFSDKLPEAATYPLLKSGDTWTEVVPTKSTTRLMVLKVVSGTSVDSNKGRGYFLDLYDGSGLPVPGNIASRAEAISHWSDTLGIAADKERALALFEEEFKIHPKIKAEYLPPYFNLIFELKKDQREKLISDQLSQIEAKPDASLQELYTDYTWRTIFQDEEGQARLLSVLKERDPEGRVNLFSLGSIRDPDEKARLVDTYAKGLSPELRPAFLREVLYSIIDRSAFVYAKQYLDSHKDIASSDDYLQLASAVLKKGRDLDIGEESAATGIEMIRDRLASPEETKPLSYSYLTTEEWRQRLNDDLGRGLKLRGEIFMKQSKDSLALQDLEEAWKLLKTRDSELNEFLLDSLIRNKKPRSALQCAEAIGQEGSLTPRIMPLVKRAYSVATGNGTGFEAYLQGLKNTSRNKRLEILRKRLVSEPAPRFVLEDLSGRRVSLSDLRGKIVLLDFWATWCRPCLESFPAMRDLVKRFEKEPDVAFLFIDCWERAKDPRGAAAGVLAGTQYPFRVLVDSEDKVSSAFGIRGVPTKVLVDGTGRIRYKSEGYDGDLENLIEEMSLAIELTRQAASHD